MLRTKGMILPAAVSRAAALSLLPVALAACGRDRGGMPPLHVELRSALEGEDKERGRLLEEVTEDVRELVATLPVGDPLQRAEVAWELGAIEREIEAETQPKRARVGELQAALEAARQQLATFSERVVTRHPSGGRRRLRCGDDGCAGSCGDCGYDAVCHDLWCWCVPDCEGRTCGSDGCGGVCGATGGCGDHEYCGESGQCQGRTADKVCRRQCQRRPSGPQTVWSRQRDHSASPSRRGARVLGRLEDATAYLERVKAKETALAAELAEIEGLDGRIAQTEEGLATLGTQAKAAGAEVKRLTAEVKDATKALKGIDEAMKPELEAALEKRTAELATAKAEDDRLGTKIKDDRKTLAELRKLRGRSEPTRKKLLVALPRVRGLVASLAETARAWRAATEQAEALDRQLRDARTEVTAAEAVARGRLEARLKPAEKRRRELAEPAVDRRLLPGWGTDPGLVRRLQPSRRDSRLPGLVDRLRELLGSRLDRWREVEAALAAEAEAEAEAEAKAAEEASAGDGAEPAEDEPADEEPGDDAPADEEPPDAWRRAAAEELQAEVVRLDRVTALLGALAASNERAAGLRRALHEEREALAD